MNNYSPNSLKKKIKSKTHKITLKNSYSGAPEKTKHQGGTFLFCRQLHNIGKERNFFFSGENQGEENCLQKKG